MIAGRRGWLSPRLPACSQVPVSSGLAAPGGLSRRLLCRRLRGRDRGRVGRLGAPLGGQLGRLAHLAVAAPGHRALDGQPQDDRDAGDELQRLRGQLRAGDQALDAVEVHGDRREHGGQEPAEAPQAHPENVDPRRVGDHEGRSGVADAGHQQPVLGEVGDVAEVPDQRECQQHEAVHGGVQDALLGELRDAGHQQEQARAEPEPGQAVLDDGDVHGLAVAGAADRALDAIVQFLNPASLRGGLKVAAGEQQHPEPDNHENDPDDGDDQRSVAPLLCGNNRTWNGHTNLHM